MHTNVQNQVNVMWQNRMSPWAGRRANLNKASQPLPHETFCNFMHVTKACVVTAIVDLFLIVITASTFAQILKLFFKLIQLIIEILKASGIVKDEVDSDRIKYYHLIVALVVIIIYGILFPGLAMLSVALMRPCLMVPIFYSRIIVFNSLVAVFVLIPKFLLVMGGLELFLLSWKKLMKLVGYGIYVSDALLKTKMKEVNTEVLRKTTPTMEQLRNTIFFFFFLLFVGFCVNVVHLVINALGWFYIRRTNDIYLASLLRQPNVPLTTVTTSNTNTNAMGAMGGSNTNNNVNVISV